MEQAPIKNPRFDEYRNSVLERPSHYNSSLMAAAEGGEVNPGEVELAE